MRIEFRVEGRLVTVEAEGAVSVRVSEDEGAGRLGADMAARLAGLRGGLSEGPAVPEEGPEARAEAGIQTGAAPPVPGAVPAPADESAPAADGLFARLSDLRRELAVAAGVPSYVVFHDKALLEMAEKRPQTLDAFSRITGVGRARLEKYGDIFLSAIREGAAA
jgi:superfamily II DNA helicase RecQ